MTTAKGISVSTMPPLNSYFRLFLDLLERESEAESRQLAELATRQSARDAEAAGTTLVGLVLREGVPGLGGRYLVSLAKKAGQPLPWTRLGPGAPVVMTANGESIRGVVAERDTSLLRVALEEPPDDESGLFRLDLAPDEASRLRQRHALEHARSATGRLAELRAVLLGDSSPQFRPPPQWSPLDAALNPSQRDAISLALAARDVSIIHGPPGTGKTTTVVELVRQAIRLGERVLVCAPSNLAVDNVLEKLLAHDENAVRLGHPARVLPALRQRSLDLLTERQPDARQARKLTKDAFALFRQAGKWTRGKPAPGAKQALREEARALLGDARRLESSATDTVLNSATVLLSTLTGLDNHLLAHRRFGLVVIDEACQATVPACWIPIARAERLVLAGDHQQLPPTILSPQAARAGLGVSLLEALVERFGPTITRRLDVQYRMNRTIMAFSSAEFYDGSLIAHPSVADHLLTDLPEVQSSPVTSAPTLFIDTAGAGYDEEKEADGESRLNPHEASLTANKVRAWLLAGLRAEQIAVITPYAAQVRLLRRLLADFPGIEIDSVDGFQGREKEAVIVSLVRSNPHGEVGFLADIRRTNVALTRARRGLIVIGDSATLSNEPFYARLVQSFEDSGAYRTVWEEPA